MDNGGWRDLDDTTLDRLLLESRGLTVCECGQERPHGEFKPVWDPNAGYAMRVCGRCQAEAPSWGGVVLEREAA